MSNEIFFYAKIGNVDKVNELIENGADVNALMAYVADAMMTRDDDIPEKEMMKEKSGDK